MVLNKKRYKDIKRKLRKVTARSIMILYNIEESEVNIFEDGILIGNSKYEINKKNKDMFISDFDINSLYQGKGYGSLLARVIIDLAKLYHLKTISLIDGANPEGFWQIMGFKRNSRMKKGTVRLEL